MKNHLLLTLMALCPVTALAMEEQISVGRRNERIMQLQIELARLQAADIEAPNSPSRRISPISMSELHAIVHAIESQPAPAAQSMQDNPPVQIRPTETTCQKIGRGIGITGGVILCLGAAGTIMWTCAKACDDCSIATNCIRHCGGNDACIQKCKNH